MKKNDKILMLNNILVEGGFLNKMSNIEIYNKLKKIINPSNIKINESMREHTSFKIGGLADFFITASSIDDVKNILNFSKENHIPLSIIGNGSNILVTDKGIRGIILKIDIQKIEIAKRIEDMANYSNLDKVAEEEEMYSLNNCLVKVGAGVKMGYLARKTFKRSNCRI